MENNTFVHEYKEQSFKKAMVIVGFPSVGLVSSIAANFIVKTLKLEKIATIISNDFPPFTIIHDGTALPPVRIYAGHRECEDHGEMCENLIVITGEFMPNPNLVRPLAETIINWCKEHDVTTILTLEGMNVGDPEEREILAVATGEKCKTMLQTYGLKEMKEGMVTGISGVLLYEGEVLGMDIICMLGPARPDFPDPRGAARMLEYVAKMLPEIKLDPDPLFKEAEILDKEMKAAAESMKPSTKRPDESHLYG